MNIANQLTCLRIAMIPVFVLLMSLPLDWGTLDLLGSQIPVAWFVAGLVFALASLTDYLDGYLARKLNLVTPFGVFADPMADKLLVLAALILLVQAQVIPAWMVIIIISRELLVTGLRVLLARENGQVLAAAWPGKVKTFTQMFAILFFLWNDLGFAWLPFSIAKVLLWVCLAFTIYSGVLYFYHGRFVFRSKA